MMIEWGGAALGQKVAGSLLGISMGVCQLPQPSKAREDAMYGTACAHLRAASDLVALPGSGDAALKVNAFAGSLGVHFTPWISLQAKGSYRGTSGFRKDSQVWALMPEGLEKRLDHAVVRLGNPALHRLRAALGNQRLPFGVDASPADDAWLVIEDRDYWGFASRGVSLAYDNLLDLQLEAGVSSQSAGHTVESSDGKSVPLRSSARLTHDLGFFERARIVVSIADDHDRMRYGFGFVSSLRNGDVTHFELLRSTGADVRLDAGFRRLFRLAYQTADRRWWLLYDDDRLRARSYAVGYRYFFTGGSESRRGQPGTADLALKFAVGGVRSLNTRIEGKTMLTAGLEASL